MVDPIKKIWSYIKSRKYLLLFSIGYFLIRLIFLDSYFLLKDERDLILTALSLAHTGKDLLGTHLPLSFTGISPQAPLLGMYWTVPFISLFHITSPLLVKIIYIFPTLFFPVLVFEFIQSITGERKISFLTAFIVSFSPWYFHISRLALEAHIAYFFCLLGLVLYLKRNKILGLTFLILSYFSYFGIRPFILISIPYIEIGNLISLPKMSWKKTVISLFIFILLFGFVYKLSTRFENTTARSTSEVILLNEEKLTLDTNFLRSISSAPFFMREFFDNKLLIISHTVFYNFFKGIDLSYLFFSGDYMEIYANQVTGQFFPFLFLFIVLGIGTFTTKKKPGYLLVAGFTIIGLIPSLINYYSLTFSVRSIFSLIGVGFICGVGIIYAYEYINKKTGKNIFVYSLTFVYLIFSIFFVYKYLFQNYKIVNNSYNEGERYLAQISENNNIKSIIVPDANSYFLSYVSTLPSISQNNLLQIQIQKRKTDNYLFGNHLFHQCLTEEITPTIIDNIKRSTIIEESCLSMNTKTYINLHEKQRFTPLYDPQFPNNNVDRKIKFYFFK